MSKYHKCQGQRVANSMGCVEPCACGGSNIHLGLITLHVERQQVPDFLQLAQGVQRQAVPLAQDAVSPEADGAATPAPTRRRRRDRIARVYH